MTIDGESEAGLAQVRAEMKQEEESRKTAARKRRQERNAKAKAERDANNVNGLDEDQLPGS